ncbi:MAG: hypothetical protein K6E98_00025, partial [Lachnospiraceae bacterium]|nr:hypothetical protein [Lachnospiraceae bacterium]
MKELLNVKSSVSRRLAAFMAFITVFTSVTFSLPEKVSAVVDDFAITGNSYGVTLDKANCAIKQGGHILTNNEDIDATDSMEVVVFIDIPNATQDKVYPTDGDIITISLPEGYNLIGSMSEQKEISFENSPVCYLMPYSEGDTSVKVKFTDVTKDNIDIKANFSFAMEYGDVDSIDKTEGKATVLFEKNFTLKIPEETKEFKLTKSGKIYSNEITWTVVVTPPSDDYDYSEYTFVDDLTDVGEYVDDSFKIDGVAVTGVENNIEYTFPEGTKGKKTITFQTIIPEGNNNSAIHNNAELYDEAGVVTNGEADVTVEDNPVEKTNENLHVNEDGKQECDWIITVDPEKLGGEIKDCTVVDYFGSIGWTIKYVGVADSKDGTYSEVTNYKVVERQETNDTKLYFNLGDISSKKYIKITTELPNGQISYKNKALVEYNGGTRTDTVYAYAYIENNGIVKSNGGYDSNTHQIDWNVVVKDPAASSKYTIDMIINVDEDSFSIDNYNWRKTSEWDEGLTFPETVEGESVWKKVGNTVSAFGQDYVQNSYTVNDGNIIHGVMEVFDKDTNMVVGHVLIVEGDNEGLAESGRVSYGYKTEIVDPSIYAGNDYVENGEEVRVTNDVIMTTKPGVIIGRSQGKVNIKPKMLVKDKMTRNMLDRYVMISDPSSSEAIEIVNAGDKYGDDTSESEGYDYLSNQVAYIIDINPAGIKVTDSRIYETDGTDSYVKFADRLPEGWEFKTIPGSDSYYAVYECTESGDEEIKSTASSYCAGLPQGWDAGDPVKDPDDNRMQIEFKIRNLDKPYKLVFIAGPTQETLNTYASSSENAKGLDNDAVFELKTGDDATPSIVSANGVGVYDRIEQYERVDVPRNVLDKAILEEDSRGQGHIKWQITYDPYIVEGTVSGDIVLEDIIPESVELRTLNDTELNFSEGNYSVIPRTINSDGTYGENENELTGEALKACFSYNASSRALKFNPPDKTKSYLITYITDIVGEDLHVGDYIVNTIRLSSYNSDVTSDTASYQLNEQDVGASFRKLGTLDVVKKDSGDLDKALAGASFELYSDEAMTVVAKAFTTDDNGEGRLTHLLPGTYYLKEVSAPKGYKCSDKVYKVEVVSSDSTVIVKVDNEEVADPKGTGLIVTDQIYETNVKISKKSVSGSDELSGAKLTLSGNGVDGKEIVFTDENIGEDKIGKGGNIIEFVSGSEPTLIKNLPDGVYTLHEKAAPEGYLVATDIEFIIENGVVSGNSVTRATTEDCAIVTMEDEAKTAEVTFSKKDAGNEAGPELSGAKIKVSTTTSGNSLEGVTTKEGPKATYTGKDNSISWTSGETAEVLSGLPAGDYVMEETAAPEGYEISTKIEFTVNA